MEEIIDKKFDLEIYINKLEKKIASLKRNIQKDIREIIGKEISPQDRINLLMKYSDKLVEKE